MSRTLESVRQMWDESAQHTDRVRAAHYVINNVPVEPRFFDDLVHYMDDQIGFRPQDVVLEIGAGPGLLIERIAPRVARIAGTDISGEILKRVPPLPNVTVEAMDSDRLTYSDASFDKIICHGVVQYFPDLAYAEACFREMVRVCKPGGAIFIGSVFNGYLEEVFQKVTATPITWRQRLRDLRRQLRGRPVEEPLRYLFVEPATYCAWAEGAGCRECRPQLQVLSSLPALFRQFRYDIVVFK